MTLILYPLILQLSFFSNGLQKYKNFLLPKVFLQKFPQKSVPALFLKIHSLYFHAIGGFDADDVNALAATV